MASEEIMKQIAESLRKPVRLSMNDLQIINHCLFHMAETHRLEGDETDLQSRIQAAIKDQTEGA